MTFMHLPLVVGWPQQAAFDNTLPGNIQNPDTLCFLLCLDPYNILFTVGGTEASSWWWQLLPHPLEVNLGSKGGVNRRAETERLAVRDICKLQARIRRQKRQRMRPPKTGVEDRTREMLVPDLQRQRATVKWLCPRSCDWWSSSAQHIAKFSLHPSLHWGNLAVLYDLLLPNGTG